MTVPFTFQPDGLRLPGVGVTLFTSDNDNPNGELVGNAAGDLCITTEPGLYQWSADATPTWVALGGAGFGGTYSGTSGINLTDNSGENINITEEGSAISLQAIGGGGVYLSAQGAEIGVTPAGVFISTAPDFNDIHLFTSASSPNGHVTGHATGDLCVTTEPALYQWNAALATPAWIEVTGFDGNFSGTTGINLTDTSDGGLYLYQNNGNNVGIGLFDGEIAFETNGGEWSFNTDGTTTIPAHGEMDPITLFTNGENPNGDLVGNAAGDLCITGEPALYQWNPALATPAWERVGVDTASTAVYAWALGTPTPYPAVKSGTSTLDGLALTGSVQDIITIPAYTYAPGAQILNGHMAQINGVPASGDGFDLEIVVAIVSLDGTNSIQVEWFNSTPPGTPAFDLSVTVPSDPTITGSDLVFDSGSGNITTTAGGIYGMSAYLNAGWD